MYKKTKPRSVMELLNKNLSEREVASTLSCSRNTVAGIIARCEKYGKTWDDIKDLSDDQVYEMLFPEKFKVKPKYVPVDYGYVHSELKKVGVTMLLLWEEYKDKCISEDLKYCSYPTFNLNYYKFTNSKNYTSHVEHKPGVEIEVDWSGPTMNYVDPDTGEIVTAYLFVATLPYSQYGYVEATIDMKEKAWLECHVHMFEFFGGTPVKVVCDNLKTGVISHPKNGEIILNDAYLALGEYYNVAIMPTGVKKPKQKASVEGSVGKIATAVIAKLRNEIFTSLESLNKAIMKAVKEYNDKAFQKRDGSRSSVFNTQEKTYLRALPFIPYEVCEWSYGYKVGKNSHISFNKGQYSVPCRYIGNKVDVKFNSHLVFIYYNRTEIARHEILPKGIIDGVRTEESHLPFPLKKNLFYEDIIDAAREIGSKTFEVIRRMYDEAKVKEQPTQTARSILAIADTFSPEILEEACNRGLRQYHIPYYSTIYKHAKYINNQTEKKDFIKSNKSTGIVRGADYYKKGDTN